ASCRALRDLHSFPTRRSSDLKTKRFGYAEPDYQIYLRNLIVDIGLAAGDTGVIRWFFNGDPVAVDSRSLVDGINRFSLPPATTLDRKSTRLNSSHVKSSYAVF